MDNRTGFGIYLRYIFAKIIFLTIFAAPNEEVTSLASENP